MRNIIVGNIYKIFYENEYIACGELNSSQQEGVEKY